MLGTKKINLPKAAPSELGVKATEKNISFLLGAGFSVNQGYPTANQLNKKIETLNLDEFSVFGDGSLIQLPPLGKDPNYYLPEATSKHFFKDLIALFIKEHREFDYEKFYDFIVNPKLIKTKGFIETVKEFRKRNNIDIKNPPFEFRDDRLINKSIKLINQFIEILLVDKDSKSFYESVHQMRPLPDEYTGILELMEKLGKSSTIHIHTLNHDLLFETFNQTDWINGELSNGFDELGSKFYGRIEDNKMVRLEYFSNRYNTNFRLYKLHGSLDQFPFRHQDGSSTEYIKIKQGINTSNLYKEVQDENGQYLYENDFTNYYADFLSGTTHKILRYNDGYYKEIFTHFKKNLEESEKLVIIGYGCKDTKINEYILDHFDYKNKESIIVDPYPSDEVKLFAKKLGAKLIEQTPAESIINKI